MGDSLISLSNCLHPVWTSEPFGSGRTDDAQTASGAQRHHSLTRDIGRHFLLCSCYGRLDLFLSAVDRLIGAALNLRPVRRA